MGILLYLVYAVVAYVLLKVGISLYTKRSNERKAARLGCKPAPWFPSPDPLGISPILDLIKANEKGLLPEYLRSRFDTVAKAENHPANTISTSFLGVHLYQTRDPKNIQAVLATQFKEFILGPIRYGTFSPLLGGGIFSADGKQWEHSRALLRPQFARDQVSDLELEERHVQHLFKAIGARNNGWSDVVDLLPLFFRFTVDSASEFLFGESVNSQLIALENDEKRGSDDRADFVKALDDAQDGIAYAFRFNDFYKYFLTKTFYDDCKRVHGFIDPFIKQSLSRGTKKEGEKYIFLDELSSVTKDPIEIRDQTLSILLAGRDTTAGLLSFLLLTLAQQPEIFSKLRETIISDLGHDVSQISFSSLKSCQYLQWCLSEALRLYPSVPINSRRAIVDTTLPRGGGPDGQSPLFVPAGTDVNYSVYAMMRSTEFWGADADVFKPERWNGRKPGFEFLPFNGGPRICLGQQFALTEAGYVVVRLLQHFDQIDGLGNTGAIPWYLTLTGRPRDGVKVRLHAANA